MKTERFLSVACGLLLLPLSYAQTVSDDLSWISNNPIYSQTSPNFDFCDGEVNNYFISSPVEPFVNVAVSGNPALTNGLIIPANTAGTSTTDIPVTITFKVAVCNLRIHFTDLDGAQHEEINHIAPAYDNLIDDIGDFFDPGGASDAVSSDIDNAAGWVVWNGPLTNVSFNYSRPGNGFGLVIDSITFECCQTSCECNHRAGFNSMGSITTEGALSPIINLDSGGIPVRSICVNLPFYVSQVSDDCLRCETSNLEKLGTILGAAPIAGTSATLHDPLGLGYSRTICWNFPTPVVVTQTVQIDLQFPGVLKLSCCKNQVDYCLDVTFTNEDCTACEYTICTQENAKAGGKAAANQSTSGSKERYNDFAEPSGIKLTPNPASGKVEVSLLNKELIGGQLQIVNPSGATFLKTTLKAERETLNIAQLSPGSYLVTIEQNGQKATAMLVIH